MVFTEIIDKLFNPYKVRKSYDNADPTSNIIWSAALTVLFI